MTFPRSLLRRSNFVVLHIYIVVSHFVIAVFTSYCWLTFYSVLHQIGAARVAGLG